jgi:hypothetical protein
MRTAAMIAPAFISDRLTGTQIAAGRTSRRLGSGDAERRAGDMPAAVSWTPARTAAGTIAGAGGSLSSVLPANRAGPPPRAIAEHVSRAAGVIGADMSARSVRPRLLDRELRVRQCPGWRQAGRRKGPRRRWRCARELVERLTVAHLVEPPLACHRPVSRVRVLRQSRALRPQRHESGQIMTTSVASMTFSTQQLSRTTHTRDADKSRASADLRIVLLRGHCPRAVREMVTRPGCRPMPTIRTTASSSRSTTC